MLPPIKVVDLELSQPLVTLEGLEGYQGVRGLVRLHGVPIGYVQMPVVAGCCTADSLSKQILAQHSTTILRHLLQNQLAAGRTLEQLSFEGLFNPLPSEKIAPSLSITIAICTRDRTSDLAVSLEALNRLDDPALDILVVDRAPSSDATQHLALGQFPKIRYTCEPEPSLGLACNRAIAAAKGEIIAFINDELTVDRGWVNAITQIFAENPEVMAVTGLVVPAELETEAQILFEQEGGWSGGWERTWYRLPPQTKMPQEILQTWRLGSSANIAYRRSLFERIGQFHPLLGAEHLEMCLRLLKTGHTLVYEPQAIGRYRPPRTLEQLRPQLIAQHSAQFAYCAYSAQTYPQEFRSCLQLNWRMLSQQIYRLFLASIRPSRFPREFIWAQTRSYFTTLTQLPRSHPVPETAPPTIPDSSAIAVRVVELQQPLQPLTDITSYPYVRATIAWKGSPFASIDIPNQYQPLTIARLSAAIAQHLGDQLLDPENHLSPEMRTAKAMTALQQHYAGKIAHPLQPTSLPLSDRISVSIAVATYNRPDDLRNCLRCLTTQQSRRPLEIIIIDNDPASGLTPPVVAEFPGVKLIAEPRQGLSYARNAGIAASQGEIIIATDDDVTAPPDWLEKLLAPFARPDVTIVTGNVLAEQLETPAERYFETNIGGLGRGFQPFERGGEWFDSFQLQIVPTWQVGATANAAFRASLFSHPDIGLLDERLGAGTPVGAGEESYFFYKVLKAGYTIAYEPRAFVWHKHRHELAALHRQLYNYSKAHVSWQLLTLLHHGDWRSLRNLFLGLPSFHLRRIVERLTGRSDYPLSLIGTEILGHLVGPWFLWQSQQRVQRLGRSTPYLPLSERSRNQENQTGNEG